MQTKPQSSNLTGRRAGAAKGQLCTVTGILVPHLVYESRRLNADVCLVGALDAFEEAIKLDPANAQAKSGLAAVQRAIEAEAKDDGIGGDASGGLGGLFNDPQLIQKLAGNPKTSALLADPSFMAKLQRLKQNPNNIGEEMRDPRFLQVMSVLLGIDMSFGAPGEGTGEGATFGGSREPEEDTPMPDARPSSAATGQSTKAPEPVPEPEPEDEEAAAKQKAKEEAEAEKKLGTENYKKRQFDAAIEHYSKAWELHKDITYLTNMSAAQFEKGDYKAAIETCEKAIEEGREVLADFKIIAKYVHMCLHPYNVCTNHSQSLWPYRYFV